MSIRKKTILVVALTVVVLFGVIYGLTYKFLLDGFIEVENDEAIKNALWLDDSIKANIAVLSAKSADWGRWDDSYEFVVDRNQDFIDSNLSADSLVNLGVDFMVFVATSGEVVISRLVDASNDDNINQELPAGFSSFLEPASSLLIHPDLDHLTEGIVLLESSPVLVSARPIITSSNEGPARGVIILGRYLDQVMIDELSAATHLEVRIEPKDQEVEEVSTVVVGGREFSINRISEEKISGATFLNDINNQPILKSEAVFDRVIYKQGLKAVEVFLVLYLVIGLVFIFVMVFVLERLILARLTLLGGKVDNMRATRNLDQRVVVSGSDEFAKLSQNIDDMLIDLRVSQKLVGERDQKLADESKLIADKNETLEHTQRAVLNVLEDLEVEKKRIEETVQLRTKELTEEKVKLEASINSLPVGFAIIGADRELLIHNDSLSNIFGCKHEDFSLSFLTEKLKDHLDLLSELVKIQEGGGSVIKPELLLGNKFIKLFLAPVLHATTGVLGFLLLIEDITAAKMLERTREEFFAVASHELRTPLTAIRGNMAMIKDFVLPTVNNPDLTKMINDSYDGAVRLINIVNDFLDASRLEQGRVAFNREPVDIVAVVNEVTRELESVSLEKKLTLKFEPRAADWPKVLADRDRLKQVVFNLVSNAVNYTRDGGVTIDLMLAGDKIKVSIIDTGVGISATNQQRLFKKFQQAQEKVLTRDMTKSTGLGLYISKMIVEGMGGDIALENSELGQGSTFSFTVPIAVASENKV